MPRIIALNVGHQTIAKRLPDLLVQCLIRHSPDVLIFNEYVDAGFPEEHRDLLSRVGFPYTAVTESIEYRPNHWRNQILVASNKQIENISSPQDGPDDRSRTHNLRFDIGGISITGLRVPAYGSLTTEWYPYWNWLTNTVSGDLLIGDFNADPRRGRKKDRVLQLLIEHGDWQLVKTTEDASFFGKRKGAKSLLDHALISKNVAVSEITYIREPVDLGLTDHSAVLVNVELI